MNGPKKRNIAVAGPRKSLILILILSSPLSV
jgi:hypothetical protein